MTSEGVSITVFIDSCSFARSFLVIFVVRSFLPRQRIHVLRPIYSKAGMVIISTTYGP